MYQQFFKQKGTQPSDVCSDSSQLFCLVCHSDLSCLWGELARQYWVPLAELKLSAFASSQASKTSSEGDSISSDEASSVWHAVGGSDDGLDIEPAVTALVRMLADPPSNLAATKGFSLITVPLCPTVKSGTSEEEPGCSSSNSFFPLPLGERLRLYLTDYPVPSALLDLQVGAAAGAGALEVDVSVVASGADSEYLPEAYKPLFQPT